MKKLTYLILVIALFSSSCLKTHVSPNCCTPAQRWSEITAQKNGVLWNPFFANGVLSNIDSLHIAAASVSISTGSYVKLDTLSIKLLYNSPGVYKLQGNQIYYGTFANGTITQSYQIDPTYNNEINITGYETLHNPATTNPDMIKITGTFNIRFIDPNNPAGISFSNGSFYTIMNQ